MKTIIITTLVIIAVCFVATPQISASPADGGAIGKAATGTSVVTMIRDKPSSGSSSSSRTMGSSGDMTHKTQKTQKKSSCMGSSPYKGCICKGGSWVC
jgi:hypothetical protein